MNRGVAIEHHVIDGVLDIVMREPESRRKRALGVKVNQEDFTAVLGQAGAHIDG